MKTATLRKDALTETYEDVKNLIYKTAWKFQASHGGDIKEYIAEANKEFVRAYDAFDSSKEIEFTTLLTTFIKNGLRNFLYQEWRQSHPSLKRIVKHKPPQQFAEETFSIMELLDEIEEDAQIILQLFLDTPKEVFVNIVNENQNMRIQIKKRLRNRLRQMGWTIRHITESFDEIAQAIQN